jgi:hypothetical protein
MQAAVSVEQRTGNGSSSPCTNSAGLQGLAVCAPDRYGRRPGPAFLATSERGLAEMWTLIRPLPCWWALVHTFSREPGGGSEVQDGRNAYF